MSQVTSYSTSGSSGVITLTADSGGAISTNGLGTIFITGAAGITTSGNAGTNTITVTAGETIANRYLADSGGYAIPIANTLNILGSPTSILSTSRSSNTITTVFHNGSNGQVIIGGGSNPAWANITSTSGSIQLTTGANTLNLETNGAVPYVAIPVASPYVAATSDCFISVRTGFIPIDIYLPVGDIPTGKVFIIKDNLGYADIANITITTQDHICFFDSFSYSYVMNTPFQSVQVIFNGTDYEVF